MTRGLLVLFVLATLAAAGPQASSAQECVGDCDGDRRVLVNELVLGVGIVLERQPLSLCAALANAQHVVDVAQLVTAVGHALGGCPPVATATPTGTAVATPTPTGEPVLPPAACAALKGRTLGGATVTATTLIAATTAFPEYCSVRGTIAPKLNFEVRLPSQWNGRALFVGGGGLNGSIPSGQALLFSPSKATAGYVTIATDSGHQGSASDGSWALDDPQAVENFAFLATHRVLGAARAIIAERYGRAAVRTYFYGTSQGGREGLIAAQRWPEDFDGIAALEPVYDFTMLSVAIDRVAQHVFATPGGRLSTGKVATLAHAVLAACDGLDGLADGIIANVAACQFDPAALRCTADDSDQCLSDAQVDTVNAIHDELILDFPLANDVRSYPGWPLGHEDGPAAWAFWIMGSTPDPTTALGFSLADPTLRFLIAHDATLDTLQFSPSEHRDELVAFSMLTDATEPDLSAFGARGGKLILWHGLADYGVSARSTARYYERVVSTLGQDGADRFIRFYTSPGVGHINDGPGAGTIDFLGALTAWVEGDTAPGDLVAVKLAPGLSQPVLSRPLCRYPTYPRYDGAGDPTAAASFACTAP